MTENFRKTTQHLMPARHPSPTEGIYDIYPGYQVPADSIEVGFDAIAQKIHGHRFVQIDGYIGVLWEDFRQKLDRELLKLGINAIWIDFSKGLISEEKVDALVEPFLGGDDPLFGKKYSGSISDFLDDNKIDDLFAFHEEKRTVIVYGCGAEACGTAGYLVYIDIPKNEIQFRSRAGSVSNFGISRVDPPKKQYKRFYFVDWPVLSFHKALTLPAIDLIVDGQRPDEPTSCDGQIMRDALKKMAYNFFRVRPWFEPGPWGGQWIREKIPGLSPEVPNYAWSFELIVPENGLILESDGLMLEISFDFLMFQEKTAVLGDCAGRFGWEFPIRFDFLDTFEGGNLSLQCHPRPRYIRENFGEYFTQDETYYILDCGPDAEVYLGFKEGVNPAEFRAALDKSFRHGTEFDVREFVNVEHASKHDLFLIPNGTIHCSGINSLVLEISATPYIFTFKMYDWMRMDLDGKPRPLNIDRAFDNLYFERQGNRVREELVSKQRLVDSGADRKLFHVPTHAHHFYDVYRHEFSSAVDIETNGSVHVLSLVEGDAVRLETANGETATFHYAETFVVSAAAEKYRLVSVNGKPLKVVLALMKNPIPTAAFE